MPNAAPADIETRLTKADPALGPMIDAVIARKGRQRIVPSRATPFEALARAVVYQSISGKAAAVIFSQLRKSVGGALTPAKVLRVPLAPLTEAGLSNAKANAIRGLAEWFTANPEIAKILPDQSDEDVIRALTGIAGIGAWTVNVFLIFSLGRLDVLPAGDFGIRRGVQLVYGLKEIPTPKTVHEKAELWRPYRSIASMYLWNAVKLKLNPEVFYQRTRS